MSDIEWKILTALIFWVWGVLVGYAIGRTWK